MIKKVLGNALLSIFMSKSAKKNFFALRSRKSQNSGSKLPSAMNSKNPSKSAAKAHNPDINREDLIRNALEAHKENSNVLDDLNESQKKRLRQLAMQTMFEKSLKSNKAQKKFIKKPPFADTVSPTANSAKATSPSSMRQTLIKNAMVAHKKHSIVLGDLNADQKQKLQNLAMQIMFGKINK